MSTEVTGDLAPQVNLVLLATEIDNLSSDIRTGYAGPDPDTAVRQALNATDTWEKLEAAGDDVFGIESVLEALNRLDATVGDEESWAVRVVDGVKSGDFRRSLRLLAAQRSPAIFSILERAVDAEPTSLSAEWPTMRLVEDVMFARAGYLSHWPDNNRRRPLPDFMQRLMERPYFARACLDSEHLRLEKTSDIRVGLRIARDAEYAILENVLGLDDDQSAEYRLALSPRTMKRTEFGEVIKLEEGGALDRDAWHTAMKWYIDNFNFLGSQRVRLLRNDWGIVNLDRYAPGQLQRMARLSEGDRELIEHLKNNDVTLMLTDRFGDPGEISADHIEAEETLDETLLFSEVGNVWGVYHPFVKLARRYGIKVSTAIASAHGGAGYFGFGLFGKANAYGEAFDIGITNDPDPESRYTSDLFFDLRDTSLAHFLHEYMVPSRLTGERTIRLLSCGQAKRPDKIRLSTAEALTWLTNVGDNVVVVAAEGLLTWNAAAGRYWEFKSNELARLHTFRKISQTTVRLTIGEAPKGLAA